MKELKITSVLLAMVVSFSSCYYDVEEELYPSIECATLDMSYQSDILQILVADCYACHSTSANFGNVTIEGYDALLKYVNDGRLLGVIKHGGGYSPMPKGGAKLLDCEIAKIETWINDGALNN